MSRNTYPDPPDPTGRVAFGNPWIAAGLTLLGTGLGQLFNGQVALALTCFSLEAGFLLVAGALGLGLTPGGFRTLLFLGLALKACAGLQAALAARRRSALRPGWANAWYSYAVFWALTQLAAIPLAWQWGPGVTVYAVPSSSMEPTLFPGETILAHTRAYRDAGPARGDVAVFKRPGIPLQLMVKRVAGLPGERAEGEDGRIVFRRDAAQPPECYFMLGDNRDDSLDSRAFGCVPRENLVARALFVWSSPIPGRAGTVLR